MGTAMITFMAIGFKSTEDTPPGNSTDSATYIAIAIAMEFLGFKYSKDFKDSKDSILIAIVAATIELTSVVKVEFIRSLAVGFTVSISWS